MLGYKKKVLSFLPTFDNVSKGYFCVLCEGIWKGYLVIIKWHYYKNDPGWIKQYPLVI